MPIELAVYDKITGIISGINSRLTDLFLASLVGTSECSEDRQVELMETLSNKLIYLKSIERELLIELEYNYIKDRENGFKRYVSLLRHKIQSTKEFYYNKIVNSNIPAKISVVKDANIYARTKEELFKDVEEGDLNEAIWAYGLGYYGHITGSGKVYGGIGADELLVIYVWMLTEFAEAIASKENELTQSNEATETTIEESDGLLTEPRHKLLLLHELGILGLLNEKYNIKDKQFGKLLGLITGKHSDTFRKEWKNVLYSTNTSKGEKAITAKGIKAVKSALNNIGIEVKSLPNLED